MGNNKDILEKVRNLPPNWWKYYSAADTLCKLFKKHLLPLFIAGKNSGEYRYSVYAGVYLQINERFVWLTAGHVVESFQKDISTIGCNSVSVRWLDGLNIEHAENTPFNLSNYQTYSWKDEGLDIGIIIPSNLDIDNINRNKGIESINSKIWKNLYNAKPEGYFAVGLPRSLTNYSHEKFGNNKIKHTVTAEIICIPLEQREPPEILKNESNWSDMRAFYGKIKPYEDAPDLDIDDEKGMSGGPIFSIERDEDGKLRYRLVGIIHQASHSHMFIRAESIDLIAEKLNSLISLRK